MNRTELFDKRIKGQLNEEETKFFEQQLQTDDFKEAFARHKRLAEGIAYAEAIALKEMFIEEDKNVSLNRFKWVWKAAAALVFLMVTIYFINKQVDKPDYDQLFMSEYVPYPNVITPLERQEEVDGENPYLLYEAGEYSEFIDHLLSQPSLDEYQQFYLGQAYLALRNLDEAASYFSSVNTSSDLYGQALWYLSLIHIKQKNVDLASEKLTMLVRLDNGYAARAQQLLDQL
ncbi:MAG: hypothetical protein AAF843_10810 [Bacteroidota bacterium]